MGTENRVYTVEFKENAVRRMLAGQRVKALGQELGVSIYSLYQWREIYVREGLKGFRRRGRPAGSPGVAAAVRAEEAAQQRIAALERKVGQQSLDIDFLKRAFQRVKESRQKNTGAGATASTGRSAL